MTSGAQDPELGDHYFDHRVTRGDEAAAMVIGIAMIIGGFIAWRFTDVEGSEIIFTFAALFGVLFFIGGLTNFIIKKPGIYHVYKNGVRVDAAGSTRDLSYSEVKSITYAARRMRGFGSNDSLVLKFVSGMTIRLRQHTSGSKFLGDRSQVNQLYALGLLIARSMANEWQVRLAAEETIPWVTNMHISKEGVHKSQKLYPWHALSPIQIDQGWYIFKSADGHLISTHRCAAADFLPGFVLINQQIESADERL